MARIIIPILTALVHAPGGDECGRVQFPQKDYVSSLPPELIARMARELDFYSLTNLMATKGKSSPHHVTTQARDVLQKRLIPLNGDITWFSSDDGAAVFRNPMKIRRFFEVIRFLYPEFDAVWAEMRDSHSLAEMVRKAKQLTTRPIGNFIIKLYFRARLSLSYFLDTSPDPISRLDRLISRTVFQKFDAPHVDRADGYEGENPMTSETYVVFPKAIRPKHREKLYAAIDWKYLEQKTEGSLSVTPRAHFFGKQWARLRMFTGRYRKKKLPNSWFK